MQNTRLLMGILFAVLFLFSPPFAVVLANGDNMSSPASPSLPDWVLRSTFFKTVMGADETAFLDNLADPQKYNKLPQHFLFKADNDGMMSINNFKAGKIELIPLGELRNVTKKLVKKGGGTFNVIAGDPNNKDKRLVDIGTLQADPGNKDAVFQVASNFSMLEPTGITHFPEQGVTGYIHDKTQGPLASISAAPGLIARMYYAFYKQGTEPHGWRQTKDRQINLLDKVSHTLPVKNGYIVFADENDAILKKPFTDKDAEKVKVGIHRDIQVTSGTANLIGGYHKVVDDPHQIINQIFCAAISFGGEVPMHSALKSKKNRHIVEKAQKILDVQYEGTLRATSAIGKSKVFLTLVGAGAFRNGVASVVQAIQKNEQFIKDSGLEVFLIVRTETNLTDDLEAKKIVDDLVKNTGGTYERR